MAGGPDHRGVFRHQYICDGAEILLIFGVRYPATRGLGSSELFGDVASSDMPPDPAIDRSFCPAALHGASPVPPEQGRT